MVATKRRAGPVGLRPSLVAGLIVLIVLQTSCHNTAAALHDFPPKTEPCTDHGGGDEKMFVLHEANMTLCYEACVNDTHCAGWVYMPPNCTFPSAPKGSAFCWLKNEWTGASPDADCCRDSGYVKVPAAPPRPKPFTPFSWCSASQPVSIMVNPSNVSHIIDPLYRGCHLDLGYSHQPQALYSQLLYSASFEMGDPTATWDPTRNPDGVGWVVAMESSDVAGAAKLMNGPPDQFNTHPSISLQKTDSGSGAFGLANRGLGHEGLMFQSGKLYEGYVIARTSSSATMTVTLELQDRSTDPVKVLASQDVQLPPGNWTKLAFSLTPSQDTSCVGIEPGSDPTVGCPIYNNTYSPTAGMSDLTAHICVKCGGQFMAGLRAAGQVEIAFSFLQPGAWGRFGNLSVLASGAALLQDMGITAVRQGGSFAASADYFWKKWVPLLDEGMPSVRWGHDVETGWGPFHLIDLCNALGIEPIVTTFAANQPAGPEDMADFVEYCYGTEETEWGKKRIDGGHVEPYKWRFIELGNEQYNAQYVDQVTAMEERAAKLGLAKFFYYMFPSNAGVNATDQERADALSLGDHLLIDIHDGPFGAVGITRSNLKKFPTWGMINAETNCGDHTVHRMLEEAADLISFFDAGISQLHGRAGSFCFERSGYQEGGLNDQGISFFLPNMTWLQPPGHIHAMVANAWQPNAASAQVTGCGAWCSVGPCVTAHVQVSDDQANASLYILNMTPTEVNATLSFSEQWQLGPSELYGFQIASPNLQEANTPGNPMAVSPYQVTVDVSQPLQLPAQSFTILTAPGKERAPI